MSSEVHISEAARRLGVSVTLLRRLEREEKIPSERRDFNGRLYSEDDLAPRLGTGGGGLSL
jgi:DNA-binding transcriptional MerR regulator